MKEGYTEKFPTSADCPHWKSLCRLWSWSMAPCQLHLIGNFKKHCSDLWGLFQFKNIPGKNSSGSSSCIVNILLSMLLTLPLTPPLEVQKCRFAGSHSSHMAANRNQMVAAKILSFTYSPDRSHNYFEPKTGSLTHSELLRDTEYSSPKLSHFLLSKATSQSYYVALSLCLSAKYRQFLLSRGDLFFVRMNLDLKQGLKEHHHRA